MICGYPRIAGRYDVSCQLMTLRLNEYQLVVYYIRTPGGITLTTRTTTCMNSTTTAVDSTEQSVLTFAIVLCCLTEGAFAIISNALLLFLFYKNPLKDMRGTVSVLIFNVALSDFFAGCIFIFWNTSHWHNFWGENWLIDATTLTVWMPTLTSTFTLVVLSFERYVVVKRPWDGYRFVTKKRSVLACAATWLLSLVLCVAFVNNRVVFILVLSTVIEISVIIQILFYVLLWRQRTSEVDSSPELNHERDEQRQLTIVVFLLVLMLIATVLPLVFCYQLTIVLELIEKLPKESARLSYVVFYLLPLYATNFFLNPVIYAWRLKKYRNSFFAVFCRHKMNQPTNSFQLVHQQPLTGEEI